MMLLCSSLTFGPRRASISARSTCAMPTTRGCSAVPLAARASFLFAVGGLDWWARVAEGSGGEGELWIEGPQLGRGYAGRFQRAIAEEWLRWMRVELHGQVEAGWPWLFLAATRPARAAENCMAGASRCAGAGLRLRMWRWARAHGGDADAWRPRRARGLWCRRTDEWLQSALLSPWPPLPPWPLPRRRARLRARRRRRPRTLRIAHSPNEQRVAHALVCAVAVGHPLAECGRVQLAGAHAPPVSCTSSGQVDRRRLARWALPTLFLDCAGAPAAQLALGGDDSVTLGWDCRDGAPT